MAFSLSALEEARKEGYSDDEIYSYLGDSDPRFREARDSGYSLDEVATHLSQPKTGRLSEFGSRVARGVELGAEDVAVGFRQQVADMFRSQQNPFVGVQPEEASEQIPQLVEQAQGTAQELESLKGQPFGEYMASGANSAEILQRDTEAQTALRQAQEATEGQTTESFTGRLSRSAEELAQEGQERKEELVNKYSGSISPVRNQEFWMGVADSLGQSIPSTAAAVANPQFGLALMFSQTYANARDEYVVSREAQGLPVNNEEASTYATEQAVAQTPLELFGDVAIAGTIGRSLGSLIDKGASPGTVANWIKDRAIDLGKSAAGESLITTPSQSIAESVIAEGTGVRDQTSVGEKLATAASQIPQAAAQSLLMGGGPIAVEGTTRAGQIALDRLYDKKAGKAIILDAAAVEAENNYAPQTAQALQVEADKQFTNPPNSEEIDETLAEEEALRKLEEEAIQVESDERFAPPPNLETSPANERTTDTTAPDSSSDANPQEGFEQNSATTEGTERSGRAQERNGSLLQAAATRARIEGASPGGGELSDEALFGGLEALSPISGERIVQMRRVPERSSEVDVYYDTETDRAVKVFHAGKRGMAVELTDADATIRDASMSELLDRIELFNTTFNSDIQIEGITQLPDELDDSVLEQPRIVVSQEWVPGVVPTQEEADAYMRSLGFESGRRTKQWFRPSDGIYVADARADNFIKAPDGIRAIDLLVVEATPTTSRSSIAQEASNEVSPEITQEVTEEVPVPEVPTGSPVQEPTQTTRRVQLRGGPQTFEVIEEIPQSERELELGEKFYRVRNERTGEEQVVEEMDLKPVASKKTPRETGESYKKLVREAKIEARRTAFGNPSKRSRKEGGFVQVDAIAEGIQEAGRFFLETAQDFADWSKKMVRTFGETITDALQAIYDFLNTGGGRLFPSAAERGSIPSSNNPWAIIDTTSDEPRTSNSVRDTLQFETIPDAELTSSERGALERLNMAAQRNPRLAVVPGRGEQGLHRLGRPSQDQGLFAGIQRVFKDVFGKDVVVVTTMDETQPSGFVFGDSPNAIYLNAEGRYPASFLIGHEFGHNLRDQPELYAQLQEYVKDKATPEYLKSLDELGYGPENYQDEFIADFIGNHFNDPEFWRTMSKEDKPLFRRVVDAFKDFLASIQDRISSLGYRNLSETFPEWEVSRKWLADLLEGYDPGVAQEVNDAELAYALPEPTNRQIISDLKKRGVKMSSLKDKTAKEIREMWAANEGPGTANIEETPQSYEQRQFGERFIDDERIAQEIRDNTGNLFYKPIPNNLTADQAVQFVEERGIPESIAAIQDETNGMDFRTRSAVGQLVIQRLNQAYQGLKESNPEEATRVLDQASRLAEWQMDYGTRLGQGVQAFAMWSRLTPEGKILSYRKSVKKARDRYTQENPGDIQEIADVANSDESAVKKIEALKALLKKNKTLKKAKNKISEIIDAAKTGQLTDQEIYDIISDRLGLPSYTPQIAEQIRDLAAKVDAAPEGIPKDRAILELSKFLASQKGFSFTDLPLGIFYGNILSGYNTHLVNVLDTMLNVGSEISGLALANPKAAMNIVSSMARGMREGQADALLALTEGRLATQEKWMEVARLMEVAEFGKKGGVPIKTDTAAGRFTKGIAESKLAYPFNGWKYVGRLMSAEDAISFRGAKEARAALLAYRMAENEGLKGNAAQDRMKEILGLDKMPNFIKQAEADGFEGQAAIARAIEMRESVRDAAISQGSSEFASDATYNHDPHGLLGVLSKGFENTINTLSERSPYAGLVARTIVPFTRIVANVTNRGLNYTPWGYKRAFMGYTGEGAPSGDAQAAALARANIGMAALTTLGVLAATGAIVVHGAGPSDDERRKQMQSAGWKPYSIQIGDTYLNYTYTPIGLMLSIMGNMMDSERYSELESKDNLTRATYAVSRLGSTVFNQSFLSGISGLFDALSDDPRKSIGGIRNWIARTTGAYTQPNILRDVRSLWNPTQYSSEGVAQDLIRNTPFGGLALRPTLNALGEPVQLPRQRFFTQESQDPAWQLLLEKGLRVSLPSRTTTSKAGGTEPLSQSQYYAYLQQSGQATKKWILRNQDRLRKMTQEDAQEALSDAGREIREPILKRIRREKSE